MCAYVEANDRQLTDDDFRDIILNFLIAGRDTTAQVCLASRRYLEYLYLIVVFYWW